MSGEKNSKIKEFKRTVSDIVEIIHQIRISSVRGSFDNILSTSNLVKEIIGELRTPEMVKNIENFRLISENINETATKMQDTLKHLEDTGIINEANGLIKSVKGTIDLFASESSINGQDLREMSTSVKEMFKSLRSLVDELRITVAYAKRSGTVQSIEETVREASSMRSDLTV